jgi:hypothetical protein
VKRLIGRFLLIACGVLCFFSISGIQVPHAHAVGGTSVTITSPQANGKATGHVGTKVQIDGTGFNPGTINLYTTTSNDTTKCINSGDPTSLGLTVFSSSPTVVAGQDGTFSLQTTWPDSAGSGGTSYFICAAASGPSALSTNTFTVAPPVQITVMPSTVPQGGQVTVTGSNWLPPQALTVAIVVGNSAAPPLVTQTISSDATGAFTVSLTIPANADIGVYSVSVNAQNEPTSAMTIVQNDSLTVTLTSTPTPTPTTTPTVTPSVTPTPTTVTSTVPTQTNNTGGANTNSGSVSPMLLLALGGLGVLLIIVGIVLFVVYAKQA